MPGAVYLGLVLALLVMSLVLSAVGQAFLPRSEGVLLRQAACCRGAGSRRADAWLMVFRGIVAAYSSALLLHNIFIKAGGLKGLCFFTVWSYILLAVYFWAAAVAGWIHRKRTGDQNEEACSLESARSPFTFADPLPSPLARCCHLLFQTLVASALMLDVVLWGVLYPTDKSPGHETELNFVSYNMHALNLVFVVVDMVFNRHPVVMRDIAVAVLWPVIYSMFTVLRVVVSPSKRGCLTEHAKPACDTPAPPKNYGQVVWPYFFMDTSKPLAAAWYLGLALFFAACYAGIAGISRLREARSVRAARGQTESSEIARRSGAQPS